MRQKCLKLIAIVAVVGAIVCVATYAGKQEKDPLPSAVRAAINELYPDAVIEEAKLEEEAVKVYGVELKQAGQEFEVTLALDGTIMEVESELAVSDLPAAVKAAVIQASAGAEIEQVKEEVTYWVVTLRKLETPKVTYEAELIKDGQEVEIELAVDGTILKQEVEDEDDDDGDDDEDEQQLSIDEVPAAVKATILVEANGGTIKEIERENEDGQTVYEAEVVIDGQEVEIKVAEDGRLLGKELEDDDDD